MNTNKCDKHSTPIKYTGKSCPYCGFTDGLIGKLQQEYARGFADGVMAVDKERIEREAEKEGVNERKD